MSKKKGGAKKKKSEVNGDIVSVARNKKVRHEYEILDTWEVGIVLVGSEVKALREGNLQWADAHARLDDREELWLYGLHIAEYKQAGAFNHLPTARRKLLMNKREIRKLIGTLKQKGLSLVPQSCYFRKGWAKLDLCLVRGKKHQDKRRDLQDRERQRDIERAIRRG
jgi:SsrA-binding protein